MTDNGEMQMSRISPQLICFSYHKSGTSLLLHVMTNVSRKLGLTISNQYGLVERLDFDPDIVLLPHSLLRSPLDRSYRAIRFIRDPRDIWVSGYLYHLRCTENWCTNTDLDFTPPIEWPRVDYSFAHWNDAWKRRYLERLDGKSYQQNLLDRSKSDGLDFELEGYTGCTLSTMQEWGLNGADVLDVKLEDVMADFDGAMRRIFKHFGFTPDQSEAALEVARLEDVGRMDDAAISERPQIFSRTISKWRNVLSTGQIAGFEERYGDLIRDLGYEPAGAPSRLLERKAAILLPNYVPSIAADDDEVDQIGLRSAHQPNQHRPAPSSSRRTRAAEILLSADDLILRPTHIASGTSIFVVPPGSERVRLELRLGSSTDSDAPNLSDVQFESVKVREISIRSRTGDMVISADHPYLVSGWSTPEHSGVDVSRRSDGMIEIPWADVSGPAVVSVRCAPR